ncbi:hypothetical protein OG407_35510 [Streptomyces sp. NBC_01515]|uniref:hypothetical protein n=1 Tax=Streptomyces sp. NBC_01515 TaxID=2903890 RepID=UPI003862D967
MSVDASGYAPRQAVAEAMIERYGGTVTGDAVRTFLDRGAADRVTLAEPTFRPTHIAVDAASAIHHVIGAPETAR